MVKRFFLSDCSDISESASLLPFSATLKKTQKKAVTEKKC
jgi:hypothetical protein